MSQLNRAIVSAFSGSSYQNLKTKETIIPNEAKKSEVKLAEQKASAQIEDKQE